MQVLFSKAALSTGHFMAAAECWAPGVFVWVLFCMLSVDACLIPLLLFKRTFSQRMLARLSKTYNLLTKSVGQFFQSQKEKEKKHQETLLHIHKPYKGM